MKKEIEKIFRVKREKFLKWWKVNGTLKNRLIYGAGLLATAVVCLGILVRIPSENFSSIPSTNTPIEEIETYRHPLTGVKIESAVDVLPQVFGVMVENSADAWPLSGIDEAFLVIEAPVEGNIPRFIAFFSEEQNVEKIGPVRSARSYYLDWNTEFDGIYAHVGGSPDALEEIRFNEVMDLDQFFQSEYFYRDEVARYAPHNVYTSSVDLRDSIEEMNSRYSHSIPTYGVWIFADGSALSTTSSVIHLDWSNSSGYNVDWIFDPSKNSYERRQGGGVYVADNVIILETDIGVIAGDDKGRKEIVTIGSGIAHVFQNGAEIVGTWKKESAEERLRFFDDNEKEVVLNAGKTWIEVVDTPDRLSVK
ncbi:MAG: DUF3048 domain-containing protein [Patescibacteria group bacterium]|jgi:hypothetical protein